MEGEEDGVEVDGEEKEHSRKEGSRKDLKGTVIHRFSCSLLEKRMGKRNRGN